MKKNLICFDTEFIEDGKTIDLISIGMVSGDGRQYYAVSSEFDACKASDWVKVNVLAKIPDSQPRKTRDVIRREVLGFVGDSPEFWGYYADYDWVVLCQLFGRMIDLPQSWPMYCNDLKQLAGKTPLPASDASEHHALADALWVMGGVRFLMEQI